MAFLVMACIMLTILFFIYLLWHHRNRFDEPSVFVEIALLAIFSLFCVGLVTIRIPITGRMGLHFMVWNLVLAWVPYGVSLYLRSTAKNEKIGWWSILTLVVWLLFFPNAPYMITDFQYTGNYDSRWLWLNVVTLSAYAWLGLMLGYLSLRKVHLFLNEYLGKKWGWRLVVLAMVAASYGVFLGRFQRWDSWNILTQPLDLLLDIAQTITSGRAIGMTLSLSCFLILGYLSLHFISHNKLENSREKSPIDRKNNAI